MNKNSPIGVFDSGLGGLTVIRALMERLPNESFIYFGDTARVPYGTKSAETVIHFSEQIFDFLLENVVKMVVVACNTASSIALENLQKKNKIPVIGVIEPGAMIAVQTTRLNHIGVIGTTATINSNAYSTALKTLNPDLKIKSISCPLFVPLVEEGWTEGPVVEMIAREYLTPFAENSIDTIILGCTHYPLLKTTIQKALPDGVCLIDSAEAVSIEVDRQLEEFNIKADSTHENVYFRCFVTDLPQKFKELGKRFLGEALPEVTLVHLD